MTRIGQGLHAMETILLELLLRLREIGEKHEELFDSEVRERMGNAVMLGFIKCEPAYKLPEDFGMFTSEANARVRQDLGTYLEAANCRAAEIELNTFHERLAAFQNPSVRTPTEPWYDFDEFFGTTNPGCYDADGNVVDPNLR